MAVRGVVPHDEKIFVTKTGFGLKKKYYPDAIKKIKELAKRESIMAKNRKRK